MDNKKLFYIFLDVDGVLNLFNVPWATSHDHVRQPGVHGDECDKFGRFGVSQQLVDNLKYLYEYFEKSYDTIIVISSTWRIGLLKELSELLTYCGFNYTKGEFLATRFLGGNRGAEITAALNTLGLASSSRNYLVIDDEIFDMKHAIPKRAILKTSGYKGGLTRELVDSYIKKFERLGLKNVSKKH